MQQTIDMDLQQDYDTQNCDKYGNIPNVDVLLVFVYFVCVRTMCIRVYSCVPMIPMNMNPMFGINPYNVNMNMGFHHTW